MNDNEFDDIDKEQATRRFSEELLKMGGKVIKTTHGGYVTLVGEIRRPKQP